MAHDSDSSSDREMPVLLLAPSGRDARLVAEALDEEGIRVEQCASLKDVVRRVSNGFPVGAAVIADEAVSPDGVKRLNDALDAQPAWSDVPVILLARRRGRTNLLASLAARRSAWWLSRPMRLATFRSAVHSALVYRNRQYELRDSLHRLREVNERLEERIRELGRLARQLTHAEERERRRLADILHEDLQQILVAVNYHVHLLPDVPPKKPGGPDIVSELRKMVGEAIEKARTLSHDLSPPILHHSGLVPALHWLGEQMGKAHGLEVRVQAEEEDEPADEALATLLFRAAQELLFNVVKHAGVEQADVRLRRSGHDLHLVVEDRGIGFDPGALEGVRDADIGMGLFSVRERMDLFGGRLDVDSVPGRGSRFEIAAPAKAAAEADRSGAAARRGTQPSPDETGESDERLRVLLADDHKVLREGLRLLLSQQPEIEIVGEVDSGLDAVRSAERLCPDLILMDVSMPDMDGIEATRRIKASCPGTRIIGLSMHAESSVAKRMLEAGAEAHVTKSDHSDRLIETVLGKSPPPSGPAGRLV